MGLELQKISGNTYIISAPTNIGVYVNNQGVILIDSGNDKEAGRQIIKLLKEKGWEIKMIINTHSNADHIGGNNYIQRRSNCRIAATQLEAAFIQNPIFEPAFLWGGFPCSTFTNKFLMATPAKITDIIPSSGKILDTDLEAIPLPGHFFEMIGVKTPDNVLFLGDALFPERIIHKYHFCFFYDLASQLQTLERLEALEAEVFVPSHGIMTKDIKNLITLNRDKIKEIISVILSLCAKPTTLHLILEGLSKKYNLTFDANQYLLISSTVKSYLAYLYEKGELEMFFSASNITWQKRSNIKG